MHPLYVVTLSEAGEPRHIPEGQKGSDSAAADYRPNKKITSVATLEYALVKPQKGVLIKGKKERCYSSVVEHFLGKEEVSSSSLDNSSKVETEKKSINYKQ